MTSVFRIASPAAAVQYGVTGEMGAGPYPFLWFHLRGGVPADPRGAFAALRVLAGKGHTEESSKSGRVILFSTRVVFGGTPPGAQRPSGRGPSCKGHWPLWSTGTNPKEAGASLGVQGDAQHRYHAAGERRKMPAGSPLRSKPADSGSVHSFLLSPIPRGHAPRGASVPPIRAR